MTNWLELREQVLERDKDTCQDCGCTDGFMNVHYIIPKREGGTDELNNLITLCSKKCSKLAKCESENEEDQQEFARMLEKMYSYDMTMQNLYT
jgi:hypothetical protein